MSFFARELGNSDKARDFSAANYLEKVHGDLLPRESPRSQSQNAVSEQPLSTTR
jgi:hypothetical protein